MAASKHVSSISAPAGADLTGKRFFIAKLDASSQFILAAAATDKLMGIIDQPNVSGKGVEVVFGGTCKAVLGGIVAIGDWLTTDANGKAITTVTAGNIVIGQAMEAGVAGDVVEFKWANFVL